MAFEQSGTHFVIARNEQEAARNVLTYPNDISQGYDLETAASRLEGVRQQFGEEFDVFIVYTTVVVGPKGSELLKFNDEQ